MLLAPQYQKPREASPSLREESAGASQGPEGGSEEHLGTGQGGAASERGGASPTTPTLGGAGRGSSELSVWQRRELSVGFCSPLPAPQPHHKIG